jgi:serine/threonine protein phosphatase PrpC
MNLSAHVVVAVSPSQYGGESKNQDRARFDRRTQTACVCDGLTSSPHAAQAAKIMAQASSLILDEPKAYLETASDYLLDCRRLALASPVKISSSVPVAIRPLVQESVRASLKTSYQTTLAAIRPKMERSHIAAKMVSCGDSGIFAFSPSGQLLFTTLKKERKTTENLAHIGRKTFDFSPGDELMVESRGALVHYSRIVQKLNIQTPDNWLLCRVLRRMEKTSQSPNGSCDGALKFHTHELLAVPRYLMTPVNSIRSRSLGRLHYSRFIHRISESWTDYSALTFNLQGHTTAAFPDAYRRNQYSIVDEYFSTDTDFVICSDGFYRCFSAPAQMWQWLAEHRNPLNLRASRKKLLDDLHGQLNQRCGDDDISFIWMQSPYGKEYR